MNIITNDVEVSTPFFHENNITMNMTYETPVQSEAGQSEAGPVQSEAGQNEEENTLAHVMQTSINHAARMKEYYEECACGYRCFATYGSTMCGAILNNAKKEYEKLVKNKEIMMQPIRPMALDSQGRPHKARSPFGPALLETAGLMGEDLPTEDTNPIPWRWENRTEVPVEERGKCLLYRPVTYQHAFDQYTFDPHTFDPHTFDQHTIDQHMSRQTPFCLLRENDVVDNGTVMCLQALGHECFYGNETMKAIMEFEMPYYSKSTSEMTWVPFFVFFMIVVLMITK